MIGGAEELADTKEVLRRVEAENRQYVADLQSFEKQVRCTLRGRRVPVRADYPPRRVPHRIIVPLQSGVPLPRFPCFTGN